MQTGHGVEAVRSVEVRQERHHRCQVLEFATEDQGVVAASPANIVGDLIDLADATLRKVGRRPDGLQGARTAHHREDDVGRSVTDRKHVGDAARVADAAAAAKDYADLLIGGAEFADDRVRDLVRPVGAGVLAARDNVAGKAVSLRQTVEKVLALLQVTDGDVVLLRDLKVEARAVVSLLKWLGYSVFRLRRLEGLPAQRDCRKWVCDVSARTCTWTNGKDALRGKGFDRPIPREGRQ